MSGLVSLVGAGPGDPELISLKAVDRLRRADLVLYDALLHPAVLGHAATARRFYVGKRAGRHAVAQETIHALMIRHARAGRRVVRLKCGDPFVLGRGGEEALALSAAGIPHEVVPGITSAIMAPATLGIPVTHRGLATGLVVLSGHTPAAYAPALAALPPEGLTVVVLMGFATRGDVARRLLGAGWGPGTPAALIAGAGQPAARSWVGRLDAVGHEGFDPGEAPVTLTIGATVALATAQPQAVAAGGEA
jgi:uroporphyrin-III C-methyltransferase/precorrin-2 dehydrogenase/sirohydrochlorin ferrochelatase